MKIKELMAIVLFVFLVQGCATIGDKKIASTPIAQKCEVYCEPGKTLETCERDSREIFGLDCKAVKDPEWMKDTKKQWTIRK